MLTLRQIVVILAAIRGLHYGIKGLNSWLLSPLQLVFLIINLVIEILAQVFIAYKFTGLFILWLLVIDEEIQKLVKKFIEVYKNNKKKKGN